MDIGKSRINYRNTSPIVTKKIQVITKCRKQVVGTGLICHCFTDFCVYLIKTMFMKTRIILLSCCFASLIAGKAQAPGLEWARTIGGSYTTTMAVDRSGNVVNASMSGIITKRDGAGNLVWSKKPEGQVFCRSMDINYYGDVIISGSFSGTVDFDPSPTASQTASGNQEGFMLKLDASGNFMWLKRFTGSGHGSAGGLKLDAKNNIYAIGSLNGTIDVDPGPGEHLLSGYNDHGTFVLKLDNDGNFIWASLFTGEQTMVNFQSLTIEEPGNLYLTGNFSGRADFDPSGAKFDMGTRGVQNGFVLKLDEAGLFRWAFMMEGQCNGINIQLGEDGDLFTHGTYFGTIDFDPSPSATHSLQAKRLGTYLARYDTAGNFIWGKSLSTKFNEAVTVFDMALDESNDIYLAGYFNDSVDLVLKSGTVNLISKSHSDDAFIIKAEPDGDLLWVKSFGGNFSDGIGRIRVDRWKNIYSVGSIGGTADMNPGPGVFNLGSPVDSITNFFLQKLNVDITGLDDPYVFDELEVYPNPVNDVISLVYNGETSSLDISVYNSLGELVFHADHAENNCIVDMSSMAGGLYTVLVTNGHELLGTRKIVKL
jgi:hypothetical protein